MIIVVMRAAGGVAQAWAQWYQHTTVFDGIRRYSAAKTCHEESLRVPSVGHPTYPKNIGGPSHGHGHGHGSCFTSSSSWPVPQFFGGPVMVIVMVTVAVSLLLLLPSEEVLVVAVVMVTVIVAVSLLLLNF